MSFIVLLRIHVHVHFVFFVSISICFIFRFTANRLFTDTLWNPSTIAFPNKLVELNIRSLSVLSFSFTKIMYNVAGHEFEFPVYINVTFYAIGHTTSIVFWKRACILRMCAQSSCRSSATATMIEIHADIITICVIRAEYQWNYFYANSSRDNILDFFTDRMYTPKRRKRIKIG